MFRKLFINVLWIAALAAWPSGVHAQNLDQSLDPQTSPTNSSESAARNQGTAVAAPVRANAEPSPAAGPVQHRIYAGSQNSKYTLGPTDIVTVTVMRHPEVSGDYVLNSEGKIQYEFAGDVDLSAVTKEEAANVLAKKLETYIINPEVTVKIKEYNSKVVYVVGEVGAPGKIFMRGDTITVRDALLAAGLPQLTANTDNAKLFTPSDNGNVQTRKVNVYALLYKGDLRENYVMNPGDTIYLPATLWAKIGRFINPVAQPVGSAAGTAGTVYGF